jgi:hypothetical protein
MIIYDKVLILINRYSFCKIQDGTGHLAIFLVLFLHLMKFYIWIFA